MKISYFWSGKWSICFAKLEKSVFVIVSASEMINFTNQYFMHPGIKYRAYRLEMYAEVKRFHNFITVQVIYL